LPPLDLPIALGRIRGGASPASVARAAAWAENAAALAEGNGAFERAASMAFLGRSSFGLAVSNT